MILFTGGGSAPVHAGIHTPQADTPQADTPHPATATAVDGTHATGMHSFFPNLFSDGSIISQRKEANP